MSVEDRANDPARVIPYSITQKEEAELQKNFVMHGHNKGKAGDMAKNIKSNMDNTLDRVVSFSHRLPPVSPREKSIKTIAKRSK
jgi:hypothetical protein